MQPWFCFKGPVNRFRLFLLHLETSWLTCAEGHANQFVDVTVLYAPQMLHFEKQLPRPSPAPAQSFSPAQRRNLTHGQHYVAPTLSIGPLHYETVVQFWPCSPHFHFLVLPSAISLQLRLLGQAVLPEWKPLRSRGTSRLYCLGEDACTVPYTHTSI